MDSLLLAKLEPLIVFLHLASSVVGLVAAWIVGVCLLSKMYKSPITRNNVRIMTLASTVVALCLVILWVSGLTLIVFFTLAEPEIQLNAKSWAKIFIAIGLTINTYVLHQFVLPVISRNEGSVLARVSSLKKTNFMIFTTCVSLVTWLLVVALGLFNSSGFVLSLLEIISAYFFVVLVSLTVVYSLKSYVNEKEMEKEIRVLNESLSDSKYQLEVQQHDINILTKLLKQ